MAEWLVPVLFAGGFISILVLVAWRNTNRQVTKTLARSVSPSREAFLEAMSEDVSREASEFLWDAARDGLRYHDPQLTLHPDDDLSKDLPLDDDDVTMDWPRKWAERQGFHESNFPDWPQGWPTTVRNYARWLDMAPV